MKITYSVVHYRPDPSRPTNGMMPLGVLVEAELPTLWAVTLQARVSLDVKELARLDGIGRDLLGRPFEYLSRQVENVLFAPVIHPSSALVTLATQHDWCVFVSSPQEHEVDYVEHGGATEQLETWTRALYVVHVMPPKKRPPQTGPIAPSSGAPPRWAESPKTWELPQSSASA